MTTNGFDEWYYRVGSQEIGAVKFDDLIQLASSWRIGVDTEVKLGVNGKWRRVGSIGRLVAVLPFQNPTPAVREPAVIGSNRNAGSAPPQTQPNVVPQPRRAQPSSRMGKETPAQIDTITVTSIDVRSTPAVTRTAAQVRPAPTPAPVIQPVQLPPESTSEQPRAASQVVVSVAAPVVPAAPVMPVASGGAAHRVDSSMAYQPVVAAPSYHAATPAKSPSDYRRPVPPKYPSKYKSAKSAGPGWMENLKASFTGEHGPHVIGVVVAIAFLGYWFFPRGPVRPVAVHPVKGSVVIDGQPLPNAAIVLYPVGGKKKLPANLTPHAKAAQDGSFSLGTFSSADGAPEGEFVATVFLVEETIVDGERNFSDNLLPTVYSDPGSSPFKVKITAATTVLEPLQLSRQ